ncbi:hypothetical protein X777_09409 [Ooceraea biroi]|uniref:Uncharacterized protein n=1 Tax=Ooceraea biroi TaxID=2015173 RepID=A0A026X128_OOCBI|nr:hypothetical protein X777_09409 [Ooceraea biroi]
MMFFKYGLHSTYYVDSRSIQASSEVVFSLQLGEEDNSMINVPRANYNATESTHGRLRVTSRPRNLTRFVPSTRKLYTLASRRYRMRYTQEELEWSGMCGYITARKRKIAMRLTQQRWKIS